MARKLLKSAAEFRAAFRERTNEETFAELRGEWESLQFYMPFEMMRPEVAAVFILRPEPEFAYANRMSELFQQKKEDLKRVASILTVSYCAAWDIVTFARYLYVSKYDTLTDEHIEDVRQFIQQISQPQRPQALNRVYSAMLTTILTPASDEELPHRRRTCAQKIFEAFSNLMLGPAFRVTRQVYTTIAQWMRRVLWPELYARGMLATPAPLGKGPHVDIVLCSAFSRLVFSKLSTIDSFLEGGRDYIDKDGKMYDPYILLLLYATRPLDTLDDYERTRVRRMAEGLEKDDATVIDSETVVMIDEMFGQLFRNCIKDPLRRDTRWITRVFVTVNADPIVPDVDRILHQLLSKEDMARCSLQFWRYVRLVEDYGLRLWRYIDVHEDAKETPAMNQYRWIVPGTNMIFRNPIFAYNMVTVLRSLVAAIPREGGAPADAFRRLIRRDIPPLVIPPNPNNVVIEVYPASSADYDVYMH